MSATDPGRAARARRDALELLAPYMPGALLDAFRDDAVSEIMANDAASVFVERSGAMEPLEVAGLTEQTLKRIAQHVAHRQDMDFGPDDPLLNTRLPDGSRMAAVSPPASPSVALTVRKYGSRSFTLAQLVSLGSLGAGLAGALRAAFVGGANTVVSGGTGTGKTTFLGALLREVPPGERIVTVEDTIEIRLAQPNRLQLESRDSEHVTIRRLVRAALRHRPDRLVVGEVRGGESYDLLQALNTGHGGSITTVHANTAESALNRLATMAMQARGVQLDHRTACHMAADGIRQVVQLQRSADGRRSVSAAITVRGYEDGSGFVVEPLEPGAA